MSHICANIGFVETQPETVKGGKRGQGERERESENYQEENLKLKSLEAYAVRNICRRELRIRNSSETSLVFITAQMIARDYNWLWVTGLVRLLSVFVWIGFDWYRLRLASMSFFFDILASIHSDVGRSQSKPAIHYEFQSPRTKVWERCLRLSSEIWFMQLKNV